MIPRGKGDNKEYCNKVIKEVLEHWDEGVCKKAVNKTRKEEIKNENIFQFK